MPVLDQTTLAQRFGASPNPITTMLHFWDGQYTAAAIDRVNEVMANDMLTADRGDGGGRIRPSSIGDTCARKQLLSYHGYRSDPFDKQTSAIAESGTFRHYRWQLVGLSMGWLRDIEVKVSYAPWLLAGSLDGWCIDDSVFEFKSVASTKYGRIKVAGKPLPAHEMQLRGYMIATGARAGSLVYEDRNFAEFMEFRIHRDPEEERSLNSLMTGLVEHIQANSLPPIKPGCIAASGAEFKECRFKDACFREG